MAELRAVRKQQTPTLTIEVTHVFVFWNPRLTHGHPAARANRSELHRFSGEVVSQEVSSQSGRNRRKQFIFSYLFFLRVDLSGMDTLPQSDSDIFGSLDFGPKIE